MKYKHTKASQKAEFLELIEKSPLRVGKMLEMLELPRSTYYRWKNRYEQEGLSGLENKKPGAKPWNSLLPAEQKQIVLMAKKHTDTSPRELACMISDEKGFSVSESSVYRVLRSKGMIMINVKEIQLAQEKYYKKTSHVHEMWQTDFTYIFVHGWGWYYIGGIIDDYSRYLIVYDTTKSMDGVSSADLVQKAIEKTGIHDVPVIHKPKLLSDNGSGYISKVFNQYLEYNDIKHIYSSRCHPQTCGKIERLHRSAKEKLKLVIINTPTQLEQMTAEFQLWYNEVHYHEAIGNLHPKDVYEGRAEQILKKRKELKRRTLAKRKKHNLILT